MFGTQGTVVEEKQGGVSAFLSPGIHEVKIVGVEYIESRGGTPGLKFTFEGRDNGEGFKHPSGCRMDHNKGFVLLHPGNA